MDYQFWFSLIVSIAIMLSLLGLAVLLGKHWPASRYWTFGNGFRVVFSTLFSLLFATGVVLVLIDLAQGYIDHWWYYLEFPAALIFCLFSCKRSWTEHRQRRSLAALSVPTSPS